MSRGEFHLLRYVESSSPVHRMWAGTKMLAVLALGLAAAAKPTWPAFGVLAVVAALWARAAKLPRGVVGRLPRWVLVGIAAGAFFGFLAFGRPNIHLGRATIGIGGLLEFLRFTALGSVVVVFGLLLGWTTRLADVGGAVDVLAAPARWLRFPVDEIVLAVGLSVRCLPLLAGDIRTVRAAWRVRAPQRKRNLREVVGELIELLVVIIVSSLRRSREMAEAIDARGGPRRLHRDPVRVGLPDAAAAVVVALALAAIVRL